MAVVIGFRWVRAALAYSAMSFRQLLLHADTAFAEWLSGLLAVGWGLGLLLPYDGRTADVGGAMAAVLPLEVWGTYIALMGLAQIAGAVTRTWRIRQVAAILALPFWIFVGMVIAVSGYRTVNSIAYVLFALTCVWVYWRMAAEHRALFASRRGQEREGQQHTNGAGA